MSCCSCSIYSKYCGPNGKGVKLGGNKYVMNHQPIISVKGRHALVMPKAPCSGVEWWNNDDPPGQVVTGANCPGEDIWDAAASVIADITFNSPDGADNNYGMAINPVSRRGQHQMHVHIAKVSDSLLASLSYAFHSLHLTSFYLNCGLGVGQPPKKRLEECSINFGLAPTDDNPQVTLYTGLASVAAAKPFERTYGGVPGSQQTPNPTPPPASDDPRKTSLLVVEVPPRQSNAAGQKRNWAVITNKVGPTECFFMPNNDDTLTNAC